MMCHLKKRYLDFGHVQSKGHQDVPPRPDVPFVMDCEVEEVQKELQIVPWQNYFV